MMKTGDNLLVIQSSIQTGCGASCSVPQDGQSAACGCQSDSAALPPDQSAISSIQPIKKNRDLSWQSIRSGLMFVVACIVSPCCAPLIVPIVLALLAGTPLAAWMGHNLGLIYGALTLLSAISFVLALRWMKSDPRKKPLQSIKS